MLRHADYRDNDRMITLLSPSRGRIDALIRSCRKPKSHNLNAGELFALGDFMLVEKNGRNTVTSVRLIETFYPLRNDYTRLTVGVYLLNLADAAAEPEQEQRELFMLLVHTLSRLTFSDQEWKPLLAGFLLHFSACQGFRPRLSHCVHCGKRIPDEGPFFLAELFLFKRRAHEGLHHANGDQVFLHFPVQDVILFHHDLEPGEGAAHDDHDAQGQQGHGDKQDGGQGRVHLPGVEQGHEEHDGKEVGSNRQKGGF